MIRSLILIVIAVLIAGCSVNDSIEPIAVEPHRIYSAKFDDVWQSVVASLTELNFSVKVIDKESGLINTEEVVTSSGQPLTMRSAHLYGKRRLQYSNTELISVKVLIEPVGTNQTKVRLFPNIREKTQYGSETAESNGHLENALYLLIQKNVKSS